MASLRSLFSSAVTANVPTDNLAPKAPVLGVINMSQDTGVAQGRSVITLNWAAPTENEDISAESLIASFGEVDTAFETSFDPIATYTIFEGSNTISAASFSINTNTGVGTINADAGAASAAITIDYTTVLQDLDHYIVLRKKGGSETFTDYSDVVGQASIVTVQANLASTYTDNVETLTASENGESHVYYLFAADDESSTNISATDLEGLDFIPGVPQDLAKSVSDASVQLSWSAVSNDNVNGYNMYRHTGTSLTLASLEQLNSSLITDADFDDSAGNSSNRVSSGTVAYPANGSSYMYVIESEDTTSVWSDGTQNTISGQSAALLASLTAS